MPAGVAETGTFTINHFARNGNDLDAVGSLVLGGTDFGTVATPTEVTDSPACDILHLTLGPLDLSLGLLVHLDQVNVDIAAVPGAGNLLGKLRCAVAGLLDDTGALRAITSLRNRILRTAGRSPFSAPASQRCAVASCSAALRRRSVSLR